MNDNPDKNVIQLPLPRYLALQRQANINQRPMLRHLVSAAQYLGIGALVHAWFLGPSFEQDSVWSWGYLLAWPVPLAFWLVMQALVFGLYAAGLVVFCAALWWIFTGWAERRSRRERHTRRNNR